ncbi:amino acid permease [Streptomyces catenulae]|uniref:Amino acid permease n=1 Tax=Streptomyces catenulae TaxID=66875 RepID=A0ABV2YVH6_9ACTN|nr:amino acid permease [Streptomyces catenulae]
MSGTDTRAGNGTPRGGGDAAGPVADADPAAGEPTARLAQGLLSRHMTMISIGGAVGAGLFVGSGVSIRQAGPGVLIAYALTAGIVILIMRMLAEMSVTRPDTGAFAVYGRLAFGRWAGFTSGWIYWVGWPLGLCIDAIAAAQVVHGWLPALPVWPVALVLVGVVVAVNLASVRAYGEMEFWVVWVKVAVIALFIGVGIVAVAGLLPGTPAPGTGNLLGHGGLLPMGLGGVVIATSSAMFSFSGTEIVTIAAGEAQDAAAAIRKSTRTILWRVTVFYLGSLAVVVLLLPWDDAAVGQSPFAATLTHLGLHHASTVLNIVLFAAMLSTMNSQVYASSRMLFALARDRDAPSLFARISRRGAPHTAILFTASLAALCLLLQVFHPTTAFGRLVDVTGDTVYVTWIGIAAAHLVLGRHDRAEGRRPLPGTAVWLFPALTWATLLALLALYAVMIVLPESRTDAVLALALTVAVALAGLWRQRRHPDGHGARIPLSAD